ncbi:extracellular solute-binding protein [Cohnella pontilimi]|uniref:Extracellular solute-binding protein n=1 Tax=Cohnella pontilimi TaxID=2564100 RepID=A0A4U0F9D8_9BACL|nr:extracellular solute-binding protein [Cohnella pontilimi]TJY41108.1 extracellular solute-binding protein [Cohnella pontilimi]
MQSMKKLLLTSVVAVMVSATALAGCSSDKGTKSAGQASGTPPASSAGAPASQAAAGDKFELGSEPLEFTFYGNYDWYTMPNWGDDLATKWIKENKKINVIPVQSGGDAKTKYNTMIASNDLPDVMWMERGPDVEKLRQADMLVPFDDYLDKYPNLKTWLGDAGINMLRSEDGKLYQFPNWYTNQPNGNAGYVINKKIYEELGSPKLETTDDLYNYLKLVKAKYPKVVPFESGLAKDGAALDVLYSAFGEDHFPTFVANRAVPKDGKLTSIFTDPVFRESMQFANKLYREKLMTQDALTQTRDQYKEKVLNGQIAVFADSSPTEFGDIGNVTLKAKDPKAGYFMIWPIHKEGLDKNKIFPGSYNQLGWNVSVITKAAKDPEKIFAFLDWFTGPEGQRTIFWGPPGLYQDGGEGGPDGFAKFTDKYVTDHEGRDKLMNITNSFQWNGNTVYIDKSKAAFEASLPEDSKNWATKWQSEITWKTQANSTQYINLSPAPDSEEGIIWTQLDEMFKEVRAKALMAKSEADVLSIFDKAESDAQAMGYEKVLSFMTTKWQDNVKKMNGK